MQHCARNLSFGMQQSPVFRPKCGAAIHYMLTENPPAGRWRPRRCVAPAAPAASPASPTAAAAWTAAPAGAGFRRMRALPQRLQGGDALEVYAANIAQTSRSSTLLPFAGCTAQTHTCRRARSGRGETGVLSSKPPLARLALASSAACTNVDRVAGLEQNDPQSWKQTCRCLRHAHETKGALA